MPAPKRLLATIVIGLSGFGFSGVSIAQDNLELRPNMRAADAYQLYLVDNGQRLVFSTFSYNIGDGPLEIVGGETGSGVQNVYQRVYTSTNGDTYYDRRAGTFTWHPEHNHIHFDNYATYTLQPYNAPGGSARVGHKTTFCLLDTNPAPSPYDSLPGAPSSAQYTTCSATTQGISVGWGDKYSYHLAGQDIDVSGLPSGDYSLTIDIDPNNKLLETNDTDNTSLIYIRLDFAANSVRVINEPGDPGDPPTAALSIESIEPTTTEKNRVVDVEIRGAGFAPGLPVYFEGGSGRAPEVSDIIYVNSSTITAKVTTKKGGPKRQSTWTLRVGGAYLNQAFTVYP